MTLGKGMAGMALQNPSPLNFLEIFWRRNMLRVYIKPWRKRSPFWLSIQKSLVRVESRHDRKIAYTLSTKNCWCKRILPSPSMENLPLVIHFNRSTSTRGSLPSTVTKRKGVESYIVSHREKVKGCATNGFCAGSDPPHAQGLRSESLLVKRTWKIGAYSTSSLNEVLLFQSQMTAFILPASTNLCLRQKKIAKEESWNNISSNKVVNVCKKPMDFRLKPGS